MVLRFNKQEILLWLISIVSLISVSIVSAHAAESMNEKALKLAEIELEKHFVKCGSSWYGGDNDFMGGYVEMKRKNAPSVRSYNLTEADKLNGFEWSGKITYTFQPSRRGYAKKGNIVWKDWSDFGEHFTIHSSRKNGEWHMSSSKPDDQESWVERNTWFHSCEILTGQQLVSPQATTNQSTSTSFTTIGRYSCFGNKSGCSHTIQLWRDAASGIVGLMGYPVMEADTPTSVIEQVQYNPATRALSFRATFLDPYEWKPNTPPPADKDRQRSTLMFSGKLSGSGELLQGIVLEYRNGSDTPLGKGQTVRLKRDIENTDTTIYPSLAEWREAQIQFGRIKAPPSVLPGKEIMLNMAKQYDCLSCHDIDNKKVGPAWRDVATRYRNTAGAENSLVDKVRLGGAGAWGRMPEVPHTTMPSADIRLLVQFILSL